MPKQYKCSCSSLSPFHWDSPFYQASIDWRSLARSTQASEVSTRTVNEMRGSGVEPARMHSLSSHTNTLKLDPRLFHIFAKAGGR